MTSPPPSPQVLLLLHLLHPLNLSTSPQVIFEGVPTYPTPARCWEIIDRLGVTQFYTAPTAIRSLEGLGKQWLETTTRSSLRVLGSVGEPINPEAWRWYHEEVGNGKCSIVDTYWQTETGSHVITPLPGAWQEKPGSATLVSGRWGGVMGVAGGVETSRRYSAQEQTCPPLPKC